MDTEDIIEGRRGRRQSNNARRAPARRKSAPKKRKTRGCKEKDKYIANLEIQIRNMFSANNKLVKKNNSLLDNLQYFSTMIFGNKNVKGYNASIIDEKLKYENLKQQEFSQSVKENFDVSTSSYNSVQTENEVISNQLHANKDEASVDNQLFINLTNRTESLTSINTVLAWIIFVIICIAAYFIWFSTKSLKDRLVLIKVVWIYLLIVNTLEYVLFYVYLYFRALYGGVAYTSNDYWKFPTFTIIDKLIIVLIFLSLFLE
jgi:hypothetical protein